LSSGDSELRERIRFIFELLATAVFTFDFLFAFFFVAVFFRFPATFFFGSEESRLCCDFPRGERQIELPEGEFGMMMFKDVNSCLQVNVVCVKKGSGSLVEQRDFTFF
jgi:hypothetical protein